jgi:hypothetical protein
MEAHMLKLIIVAVTTAILAFAVGVWTKSTVFATSALQPAPSTLSPAAMHLQINPRDLPVQLVGAYN